jgi:hypothetical protein
MNFIGFLTGGFSKVAKSATAELTFEEKFEKQIDQTARLKDYKKLIALIDEDKYRQAPGQIRALKYIVNKGYRDALRAIIADPACKDRIEYTHYALDYAAASDNNMWRTLLKDIQKPRNQIIVTVDTALNEIISGALRTHSYRRLKDAIDESRQYPRPGKTADETRAYYAHRALHHAFYYTQDHSILFFSEAPTSQGTSGFEYLLSIGADIHLDGGSLIQKIDESKNAALKAVVHRHLDRLAQNPPVRKLADLSRD